MILWQLWLILKLFTASVSPDFARPRHNDKDNNINRYGHPPVEVAYCKKCPDLAASDSSYETLTDLISSSRPLGILLSKIINYKIGLYIYYNAFIWHEDLKNHRQDWAKLQYRVEGISNISKTTISLNSLLFPLATNDVSTFCIVLHLYIVLVILLGLASSLPGLKGMGNEESVPSSEDSTPISETPSLYSIHSRVRSSAESTRAPSPMEAPEPDLSHLSPEEIAQIRSVMERAKNMQQEESSRARKLQEEYLDLATKIEREASLTELSEAGLPLCPICSKAELTEDGSRPDMNVCIDCEKMTCSDCGSYITPLTSRTPEWVCAMCDKRRRLVMTTGLWYHGCHPGSELPLERQITGVATDWSREPDNVMVSSMDTSSISHASSLGSRESYESSDLMTESSSWAGSRCGGDSSHSLDLGSLTRASSQNSELAKQVYEQSRMKGPGATLPKSESDEFSDLASDLDFDELTSECCKLEAVSSADESTREAKTASVSSQTENKQQSHTPTLHSLPPGDNTQTDTVGTQKNKSFTLHAQSDTESSDPLLTFTSQHKAGYQPSKLECTSKIVSQQDVDIHTGKGTDFTGNSKLQENTGNVLIPSQISDLHTDDVHRSIPSRDITSNLAGLKPACLFYRHSSTADNDLGENESDHSVTQGHDCSSSASQFESIGFHPTGTMTHSAPVMDLASLAANTTSGCHSLTSMNILHSHSLSHSSNYIMEEPLSSESEEDIDSDCTLSTSQAFNDSSTSTSDDLNETEQADSTVKPADFQSLKRQKSRQPAMDWSPVIDLSPIQDVSPSIEEAEQEDMLAKQMEEVHRQRLRNLSAEIIDFNIDGSERLQDNHCTDFKSIDLTSIFPPQLLQHISSFTSRFQQELINDDDEKDNENDADLLDDNSPFVGTLKRCNNCEDISKLGSDNSYADHTCNLDGECKLQDDDNIALNTGTTHLHTLPHSTAHISSNISAFQAPSTQLQETMEYEQGSKQLKALEDVITDEIHKITEDMENIVKQGYVEVRPIPPPKPKRKLPDPELMVSPSDDNLRSAAEANILSARTTTDESSGKMEFSMRNSPSEMPAEKCLRRQDSTEKKKAKDMKAKPCPLLVQHIESEEQVVSPHYKVMESPPTPETKTIKREFSMCRSVSPNSSSRSVSPKSSPDLDAYTYLSPVTSPDSDSSPPQPHSPSLFRIDSSEADSKLASCDINSRNYQMSLCIHSIPYSYVSYSRLPTTTDPANDSVHAVNVPQKYGNHEKATANNAVIPHISPRKSIKRFEDQTTSCNKCPLYENVKEFFAVELVHNEKYSTSLFGKDSENCASIEDVLKLDKQPKEITQYAEIFTYPVVGEFPEQLRSNSVPPVIVQELPQANRCVEPHLHQQRASVNDGQISIGERTEGLRTKIQESEEVTKQPQHEQQKESRRERRTLEKQADSGGSTSSESSAKTSTSRSSSDLSRSQDKDSSKEGKKIRRKLPPIPVGEAPVLVPKSKSKRGRPPAVMRGEVVDYDDTDLEIRDNLRQTVKPSPYTEYTEDCSVGPGNHINITVTKETTQKKFPSEGGGMSRSATTTCQTTSSNLRMHLLDVGKSKSLDSRESLQGRTNKTEAVQKNQYIQRTTSLGCGPKDETDEIIDSLISIYGIPCTEAMKSLKKRLQDELRRVTRDRRRKLEELEEIRALQMQIGALKLESEACARNRSFLDQRSKALHLHVDSQKDSRKRAPQSQSSNLTARSSPQVAPRRQRHKRQLSDPMVSKFSPIKEDKDIEIDFQIQMQEPLNIQTMKYLTDDSSQSGISDAESTRSEPVRDARYNKIKPSDYTRIFYLKNQSHDNSDERLQTSTNGQVHYHDVQFLCVSRSDQQLSSRSRSSSCYSDDEEIKVREEKKAFLQYEILKRKQQLQETARLKNELLKLARAKQSLAHSYEDIPRQDETPSPQPRSVATGIIKPIDDEPPVLYDFLTDSRRSSREPSRESSRERSRERADNTDLPFRRFRDDAQDSMVMPEHRSRDRHRHHITRYQSPPQDTKTVSNYSSTEYLAHKLESASRRYLDEPDQYGSHGWVASHHLNGSLASVQTFSQPSINRREDSSQSLSTGRTDAAKKDAGIVSSVTLPNIYSNMEEKQLRAAYREQISINLSASDVDGSPTSDVTPAMPLLDDVKAKSRTILRNIGSGSRPVSEEFSAGEVEDLLNAMYRVESDNSVDADEPIMKHMTEGGVTILKQIDRKQRPVPVEPHRYTFPVKRILVTRDAKDKSITGSGLGMKIVGGKQIAGSRELGAYVTAIYPILADQLHGELDVGDQVLEWNGVHLTGLSASEVQDIISRTNGEIEMVVRVQMPSLSPVGLCVQPESCRSSYDNLPPTCEEPVKEAPVPRPRGQHAANKQGVDPRQLAAHLQEIQETLSPADNSPSSSKGIATPSLSSSCSTPRSDPNLASSDRQQHSGSTSVSAANNRTDKESDKRYLHSSRQKQGHLPSLEKSPQHYHSQKPSTNQQHSSASRHQQRRSPPQDTIPKQQQQTKAETMQTEPATSTKAKTDRRKQLVLPTSSAQDKSHPSVVIDKRDTDACPSPAYNDRLRASPPLDYRLSVKSRSSKKARECSAFPLRTLQEAEKGEDFGLGEIQLQISHDDFDNTLNIHVIQARNLRPRDLNGQSDPFVKLYLLPGRGPENKRRTKHITKTLNPEWHQTVMFHDVARLELQNKVLEITVWDYDRFKANDFLGELIIELREFAFLDNKPHWYPLKEHVMLNSFELPKATVSPPKPRDHVQTAAGPHRHRKKLGVSSLQSRDSYEKNGGTDQRRRSLGALSENGAEQSPAARQVSSATNSPLPARRSLTSRTPIKTRSEGPQHR